MTWTTVALVFAAWCLVAVVAGLAFGRLFGVMNGVRRNDAPGGRRRVDQSEEAAGQRFPRRRVKARTKAGAAYRALAVGGAPEPPLDDQ